MHRTPGIVFVRHWHPEHGQQTRAHQRLEPPPILAHHVLGQRLEVQEQAMQGIEIQRQVVGREGDYRTTEHGHRLALGLARQ